MKLRAPLAVALVALALPAFADDCASRLATTFSHDLRDGRHVTVTGVVVPAPVEDVAKVLADITSYPTWLFTGPGRTPTLHGVTWDRASGAFTLFIGAGGKGVPLAGKLSVTNGEREVAVRASGSDEDIKEWSFELTAKPDPSCATRTLIMLRIDLVFGLKARLFGGSAKSMPLLLALAARDDLASLFVTTPERMAALGLPGITTLASGKAAVVIDSKEPVEVLACRPFGLEVDRGRALALGKRLDKDVDFGELLEDLTTAISGRHAIVSWQVHVAGQEKPIVLLDAPGTVHADAHVVPLEKGFSLTLGLGVNEPGLAGSK